MRIFVTGAAGFLGSNLADEFIKDGHSVVGCDNFIGGYVDNVNPAMEFYCEDCNNFEKMVALMKGADIVYHCAATAYEGLSVFSPRLVTNNIVGASVSVITAAIVNKVKRFILCSSMARYGHQDVVPFTEDMVCKPVDPYGIGKKVSEDYLTSLCEIHGMEYVILVPHNIIGPRQKYDDPYRNVASIMINLMLQGRQPVIYGNGDQKRCFSFVQDDIYILKKVLTAPVNREIINVGPDEEFVTINELAKIIGELIKFKVEPVYVDPRPQEVFLANCSANKARKLFAYKTKYTLRQGLQEMIEYIKKRGTRPFLYHLDLEIINEKTPKTWTDRIF